MRPWVRRLYSFICLVIAILCLWFVGSDQVLFLGVVTAFFVSTALAVFRGGKLGAWLAGISGVLLGLYAVAVILMGWEDVGGARGAIPLALGTGFVGALGLMIGIGGGLKRDQAA